MSKTFDFDDGRFGAVEEGLFGEYLVDASGNQIGEIVETAFGKEVVDSSGAPIGVAHEDWDGHYSVY